MEDLRSSLNPKSTQNLAQISPLLIFVSDYGGFKVLPSLTTNLG